MPRRRLRRLRGEADRPTVPGHGRPLDAPRSTERRLTQAHHQREQRGPPKPTAFVYSQLAADPDLGELIDFFVQEIPDRINALEAQAKSRDWNELTRTAQRIKGAAGSYGFSEITPYAARLEAAAREALPEEKILAALHELLSLCRRVRAGTPQADEPL